MSKEEKAENRAPAVDEDDLDDLDDYLDDFADDILSKPPGHDFEEKAETTTTEPKAATEGANTTGSSGKQLTEEEEIAELLKQLEKESPDAKKQLDALLKDVTTLTDKTPEPTTSSSNATGGNERDLKDTISSTLNRLKSSGAKVDESIKNEQPDQFLTDLLSQLNLDGEGGADGGDLDLSKLLGDMLDQLASKEILYEPLKDLSTKYPQWIDENKSKVPKEDLERYTSQSNIVKSIVDKFEEDSYSDTSKPHKEFISQKLEEMQNSGNPPEDLVGDFNKTGLPGLNFGSDDVPENFDKDFEQNCAQS